MQHFSLPFVIHAEGGATLWEELYEEHFRELVAYGSRMCENRELAQDLAQETFIKALMNGETLESLTPNKRRAWLYRTLKTCSSTFTAGRSWRVNMRRTCSHSFLRAPGCKTSKTSSSCML